MWGTSPDVDQKCAIRSYLLTALERSGDLSHNSNVPLVADLNVTIQMRVTIIDRMAGMNKKSCKSCYPVRKSPPQAAKFIEWSDPLISPGGGRTGCYHLRQFCHCEALKETKQFVRKLRFPIVVLGFQLAVMTSLIVRLFMERSTNQAGLSSSRPYGPLPPTPSGFHCYLSPDWPSWLSPSLATGRPFSPLSPLCSIFGQSFLS